MKFQIFLTSPFRTGFYLSLWTPFLDHFNCPLWASSGNTWSSSRYSDQDGSRSWYLICGWHHINICWINEQVLKGWVNDNLIKGEDMFCSVVTLLGGEVNHWPFQESNISVWTDPLGQAPRQSQVPSPTALEWQCVLFTFYEPLSPEGPSSSGWHNSSSWQSLLAFVESEFKPRSVALFPIELSFHINLLLNLGNFF